jgi:hydroxymethylpyrimidine pyrophosphatase-like HAD family hydrolase
MADGHPLVKNYAKFIAKGHRDDGVAEIIEELLLLPIK